MVWQNRVEERHVPAFGCPTPKQRESRSHARHQGFSFGSETLDLDRPSTPVNFNPSGGFGASDAGDTETCEGQGKFNETMSRYLNGETNSRLDKYHDDDTKKGDRTQKHDAHTFSVNTPTTGSVKTTGPEDDLDTYFINLTKAEKAKILLPLMVKSGSDPSKNVHHSVLAPDHDQSTSHVTPSSPTYPGWHPTDYAFGHERRASRPKASTVKLATEVRAWDVSSQASNKVQPGHRATEHSSSWVDPFAIHEPKEVQNDLRNPERHPPCAGWCDPKSCTDCAPEKDVCNPDVWGHCGECSNCVEVDNDHSPAWPADSHDAASTTFQQSNTAKNEKPKSAKSSFGTSTESHKQRKKNKAKRKAERRAERKAKREAELELEQEACQESEIAKSDNGNELDPPEEPATVSAWGSQPIEDDWAVPEWQCPVETGTGDGWGMIHCDSWPSVHPAPFQSDDSDVDYNCSWAEPASTHVQDDPPQPQLDYTAPYTVTYWAQLEVNGHMEYIPIDSKHVSGPEKSVIEGSMLKVWKWAQDKGLWDKIFLKDAFELAKVMGSDQAPEVGEKEVVEDHKQEMVKGMNGKQDVTKIEEPAHTKDSEQGSTNGMDSERVTKFDDNEITANPKNDSKKSVKVPTKVHEKDLNKNKGNGLHVPTAVASIFTVPQRRFTRMKHPHDYKYEDDFEVFVHDDSCACTDCRAYCDQCSCGSDW